MPSTYAINDLLLHPTLPFCCLWHYPEHNKHQPLSTRHPQLRLDQFPLHTHGLPDTEDRPCDLVTARHATLRTWTHVTQLSQQRLIITSLQVGKRGDVQLSMLGTQAHFDTLPGDVAGQQFCILPLLWHAGIHVPQHRFRQLLLPSNRLQLEGVVRTH